MKNLRISTISQKNFYHFTHLCDCKPKLHILLPILAWSSLEWRLPISQFYEILRLFRDFIVYFQIPWFLPVLSVFPGSVATLHTCWRCCFMDDHEAEMCCFINHRSRIWRSQRSYLGALTSQWCNLCEF